MNRKVPLPGVAFSKIASENVMPPLVGVISGEITTSRVDVPLGSPRACGKVTDVWLSLAASGKDDSNALKALVDVKINGTTCLTTNPYISHVSGEASQQKTTKISGDTGIVQGVLATTNTFNPGDILTYDLTVTRTASPTTEMRTFVVTVDFEPDEN